jgi:hypothetical protein
MQLQRCCHCHGQFGLVSHRFLFKRFCSRICLGVYKIKVSTAIRERASRWCSVLLPPLAFGRAQHPAEARASSPLAARVMYLSLNSPDQ